MATYELAGRKLLHAKAKRRSRRHWLHLVTLVCLLAAWYVTLAPSSINGPVTYAVVSGHSMEPTLYTGDLVMVYRQADYAIDDTVLTQVMGGLVLHKIVVLDAEIVQTQGVNNDFADTWTLPRSAILGKQVFVFKQVGTFFFYLRDNPIIFGALAALLAALLLVDPRKKKISKRLAQIMASTEREEQQAKKSYLNTLLVLFYVVAGVSLIATAFLSVNHIKFYPRIFLSLLGLVMSIVAFELLGNWLSAGKDLVEPDRSMAVFRKRLFRIAAHSEIPGPTQPIEHAQQLMTLADIGNTPILHQISPDNKVHRFFVVTEDLNYVFTLNLQALGSDKGRHKK